jgi:hypothetical protein
MNEKELIISCNREIVFLKSRLARTDYYTYKFVEGDLTEEEFEPIKAQRKEWRDRINQLENKIKDIKEMKEWELNDDL